jgi:putative addiction module killer protein
MEKELRLYRTKEGKEPFAEWLLSLKDKVAKARIQTRIDRLSVGFYGDYKYLGNNIYELRIHCNSGYRIYFAEKNDVIILLLFGGNKGTQKKDIEKAKSFWTDFQESYNENKSP